MELGINVEVPVVNICDQCKGRGGKYSRVRLGEKIACEACEGLGFHASYHLITITW